MSVFLTLADLFTQLQTCDHSKWDLPSCHRCSCYPATLRPVRMSWTHARTHADGHATGSCGSFSLVVAILDLLARRCSLAVSPAAEPRMQQAAEPQTEPESPAHIEPPRVTSSRALWGQAAEAPEAARLPALQTLPAQAADPYDFPRCCPSWCDYRSS